MILITKTSIKHQARQRGRVISTVKLLFKPCVFGVPTVDVCSSCPECSIRSACGSILVPHGIVSVAYQLSSPYVNLYPKVIRPRLLSMLFSYVVLYVMRQMYDVTESKSSTGSGGKS